MSNVTRREPEVVSEETPATLAAAMERLMPRAAVVYPPRHLTWAEAEDGVDLVYRHPGSSELVVARIPGRAQASTTDWVTISVHQTTILDTGWTVLAVSGELDIATTPVLRQRLVDLASQDLAVDLSDVSFMDSTGLGALIAAHAGATQAGRRFAVVRPGTRLRTLLEVTGMRDVLTVAEQLDDLA